MEHEQYYAKKPNGTFFVHFPNFHGLTKSEINLQFAEYGKVLSVDTRGQVSGLCFVTYETEEDVIRCLEGFKHNTSIRILKHKQHKSKDQKDPKQRQESDAEGSVKNQSNFKNKEDATKKKYSGYQGSMKSNSGWQNKGNNLKTKQESDMYGSTRSLNTFCQDYPKSNSEKEYEANDLETNKHSNILKELEHRYKYTGKGKSDLKLQKKVVEPKIKPLCPGNMKSSVKLKNKVSPKVNKGGPPPLMSADTGAILKKDTEKQQSSVETTPGSKTNSIFEDPEIYENIFEDEASDFGMSYPPCLLSSLTMQKIRGIASSPSPSIKTIRSINTQIKTDSNTCLAQEVIVANIDVTYGIRYILHLFQNFNPIAASMMKTTINSKIRYCHIYVVSWEEALAIQQKFDGYSLDGKNLIVLTSQNLIREALAT